MEIKMVLKRPEERLRGPLNLKYLVKFMERLGEV